ncbi:hypothetical protein Micbo1qcDRAFT_215077 [Microdochium bolleyi]|uniref:Short-chain dehydrogenase/reductase 3 n=1 Tax=Microdochium bolleyi TaxID=196109 RepID=A0A136ISJ5_9PEZI|nr:hypothetical protein Micbo1qcDRAFT_215077 [Microdochium bolleyi]
MTSFSSAQLESLLPAAAGLARSPRVQAGVAAVAALGLLPYINAWLSRRRANNYITDSAWDWSKEIVVVTGGCSGIGAKIVEQLERRHVKVIVLDLHKPAKEAGRNTFFYQCDLSDAAAIASTADQVRQDHGDPTVLVNNAGMGNNKMILSVPERSLQSIFAVNIIAPFLLVQQFLPAMVARNHGHVVNLASLASFSVQASNVDYACTKAALLAFHEGLKQELNHVYKAPAVRATVVHPTWVRTPMIADLIALGKLSGPIVTADDVANAVTNQLFSGYGAQVVVPSTMGWTSMIRGLPVWLQESMRDSVSKELLTATGFSS